MKCSGLPEFRARVSNPQAEHTNHVRYVAGVGCVNRTLTSGRSHSGHVRPVKIPLAAARAKSRYRLRSRFVARLEVTRPA